MKGHVKKIFTLERFVWCELALAVNCIFWKQMLIGQPSSSVYVHDEDKLYFTVPADMLFHHYPQKS